MFMNKDGAFENGTEPDSINCSLVADFHIDDNELEGITPEEAFVLGAEFCHVYEQLRWGLPFSQLIHTRNTGRVCDLCDEYQREHTLSYIDGNPRWFQLEVSE